MTVVETEGTTKSKTVEESKEKSSEKIPVSGDAQEFLRSYKELLISLHLK